MTSEYAELAALLGITEKDSETGASIGPSFDDAIKLKKGGTGKVKRISDTVFEQDAWGLRKGRDLIESEENERIKKANLDELEAADLFGMAFMPRPIFEENPRDQLRQQFCQQLMDTAEYMSLHRSTMLNDIASEIAATAFAEQFVALRTREEKTESDCSKKGKPYPGPSMGSMMSAVSSALAGAKEEVSDMDEACKAFGMGEGKPGGKMDSKRVMSLMKTVNKSETLKNIMKLAGKFRRVAQSQQRLKVGHGIDDTIGVVPGSDLSRLLPVELMKMGDATFEDDTLRRFIEGETQCWELQGVIPAGRGPIMVVVDESGSMQGEPIETAKALCLAMAWIARKQKRFIMFIAYSGRTGERLMHFPTGQWNDTQMVEWLEDFIGGGSDLDVPLVKTPNYYDSMNAPKGKTDMLLITDAIVHAPEAMGNSFMEWKKRAQCKMTTIVIGQDDAGDLNRLSDQVYCVPTIQADGEAVAAAVSI